MSLPTPVLYALLIIWEAMEFFSMPDSLNPSELGTLLPLGYA